MPFADPAVRKAYHKEYSREWFQRQTPEYKAARSESRKAAQRKWAEKNRDHYRRYYEANKHEWRSRNLKKLYGITSADYDKMLAAQGGMCAICGTAKLAKGKSKLAVDHCHATGIVRGLLCGSCNGRLGTLEVWYAKHKDKIHVYLGRVL